MEDIRHPQKSVSYFKALGFTDIYHHWPEVFLRKEDSYLGVNCNLILLPLLRGFVSFLLSIKDVALLLCCLLSLHPANGN